jgi:hypothetical protein
LSLAVRLSVVALAAGMLALVSHDPSPLLAAAVPRELIPAHAITPGDSIAASFDQAAPAAGEGEALELDARLDFRSFAGSAPAMRLVLNGTPLESDRLLNKPAVFGMPNGTTVTWADGSRWRVVYSPDFDPKRNAPGVEHQVIGASPYHLQLRVEDLIRPGGNVLAIHHVGSGLPQLEIAHVRIVSYRPSLKVTKAAPSTRQLAPPGAKSSNVNSWSAEIAPGGGVELALHPIETEMSIPGGGWRRLGAKSAGWSEVVVSGRTAKARSAEYDLDRRVEKREGYTEVTDTITNRTGADLGLLVRYVLPVSAERCSTYLGGLLLPPVPLQFERYEPQAPSAVAVTENEVIGLLPGNDVLWIHASTFRDSTGVGLQDRNLCIAAGASVQLVWRALVCPRGDYEQWLNQARATLGANFTVEGAFAFGNFHMADWPEAQLRAWIRVRSLHYLSSPAPTSSGSHGLHGPALLDSASAQAAMQRFAAAVHRAAPDVKVIAYFHAYITNRKGAEERYAQDAIQDVSGKAMYFPYPSKPKAFPLFVPTPGSAYGADLEKVLARLWELGFDGVYWDEMAYSVTPWRYGGPWDGASGDIDLRTHRLLRRKSAVPLLVQPWFEKQLDAMVAGGHVVVGNTEPVTLGLQKFHFPRFVETSNTLALLSCQLWSPIGLGDRFREPTAADVATRIQAHLEAGALYYFYMPSTNLPAANLTSYMYPTTPIELHAGTILAEERILTSRSGRYGWGDLSGHQVHLFDRAGREVPGNAHTVETNGARWTELQLEPGSTAAIVRIRNP